MSEGWVIARVPSNREFTVHTLISRPILNYTWGSKGRVPNYGKGPASYTPVEMRLSRKNQFTRLKRERRTERPFPMLPGYLFIREPEPSLITELRERGLCYGLIPDVPRASNGYAPGPLRLSDRAIQHLRARYGMEYDPETGSGHQPSTDAKARMIPGYEFEEGDYVLADDPAWLGHKMLCVAVMDTTARMVCKLFGVDHELDFRIDEVRKAG